MQTKPNNEQMRLSLIKRSQLNVKNLLVAPYNRLERVPPTTARAYPAEGGGFY